VPRTDQRLDASLEAQILGAENDAPHRVSVPARNRTTAQLGVEDILSARTVIFRMGDPS